MLIILAFKPPFAVVVCDHMQEAVMTRFDTKDDLVRARITQGEKAILFAAARKRGLTLSEFLRATATKAARRATA